MLMLETRSRNVRHTQEEMTQSTSVHSAKARANKTEASTIRTETKESKDSKDSTNRTRTKTRIRLNVGIVENTDTTRKTVGARRTPTKVVRRENTNARMQMLTILTRNHQLLNQKAKAKTSNDSKSSKTRTRTGTRTRNQLNVGIVEYAITTRRIVGPRRIRPTKMVRRDRTKTSAQHDSTKPANIEP